MLRLIYYFERVGKVYELAGIDLWLFELFGPGPW